MALWGATDELASVPKYLTPIVTFDGSSASVVDIANTAETIVITNHPFENGDLVQYKSNSNTAIGGLTDDQFYYVIIEDESTIKLATSFSDSLPANNDFINFLSLGVGDAHTLQKVPTDPDGNNIVFFLDTEEVANTDGSNFDKGLRTPGWNLYDTYTDANGATRHRVESLISMKVDPGTEANTVAYTSGDLGVYANTTIEDQTVADL